VVDVQELARADLEASPSGSGEIACDRLREYQARPPLRCPLGVAEVVQVTGGFNEFRSNLFASHDESFADPAPVALPKRTAFAWPISLPGLGIPP
jgi:hypothetical protein